MTVSTARKPAVFSPMVAVLMALVVAFALSAFVVLSAYAPDLQQGADGRAHALSMSGAGYAALPQLLRMQNQAVVVSRRSPSMTPGASLLVLTPDGPDDAETIRDLNFAGPILIVLPKWSITPDPRRGGWARRVQMLESSAVSRLLATFSGDTRLQARTGAAQVRLRREGRDVTTVGEVTQLRTITGSDWIPVFTDETGATILARSAKTPQIYVLADPDLVNNWGMRDLNTARGAVAMLNTVRAGDQAIIFDVSLNGFASNRSILRLLFDPPFLAVTLCLFAAAVLMGIHAVARFGPPRDESRAFAFGKSVLADNTAALIRLAGREATVAPRYAALEKSLVARALAAPRDLSPEAVTDFLDRMGKQRGAADSLSGLTAEAGRVQGRGDLLSLARRLHRWRLEMTREHQ